MLISAGADPFVRNKKGFSAYTFNPDIILINENNLNAVDSFGNTPLILAVDTNKYKIVKKLISLKVPVKFLPEIVTLYLVVLLL